MNVLSNSFTINGAEVSRVTAKTSITIPTTGWVANTGDYPYKLNVAISGLLATDYILVDILPDYEDVGSAAGLSNYCLEYAGGITIYAKAVPTASITANYTKIRG